MNKFLIVTVLLQASCSDYTKFNQELINEHNLSDNSLLVCCNNCSCVTYFLDSTDLNKEKNEIIQIYADSNCFGNEHKFKYIHLDQAVIDSMFEDNYNALLIKNRQGKSSMKLLKTEESRQFKEIIKEFYK